MAGLEGLLAGRVLGGRYLIEEVIGRGGMGAVYRALDERLGRRVAIKVITLHGTDPDAVERLRARFHREARAAAALPHHPNVVPVYDYGTDESLGLDFIVMELLRGQDLSTRISRSDIPPLSTALRILLQAARGLAVGHRAGLIHRDVKPGNVFLAESDNRELQVRVVDFGIAKLVDDDDTANQLTQDGRVPLSPAFASPEQLRGITHLTPASDVFSLGAVGFLLLTGQRPFSDTDRNRMSLGMPVPVPRLRTSHPNIPAGVEQVVMKALSFDPRDRYSDAGEMLHALEEAIRAVVERPTEAYAGMGLETTDEGAARISMPAQGGVAPSSIVPPLPPRPSPADEATQADATLLSAPDRHAPAGPSAPPAYLRTPPAAPPPPSTPPEGDDHTQLLGAPHHPERTLEAPPLPPAPPRHDEAQPARAFPQRAPQRRAGMPWAIWTLLGAALVALAYFGWTVMQPGTQANVTPPPPSEDSIPSIADVQPTDTAAEPSQMDAELLNTTGTSLYLRQQYDSAAINFQTAVDIDPDNAVFRRNYGLALRALGRHPEALQQFRRAVDLDPTLYEARFDLAGQYLTLGDTVTGMDELGRYADLTIRTERLASQRNRAIAIMQEIRRVQAEAAAAAAAADTALPDTLFPVDTLVTDTIGP